MNSVFLRRPHLPVAPGCLLAVLCFANLVDAGRQTTVFHGTVTRPDSHTALNLVPDHVLFAIDSSGNTRPPRVIDGVTFDSNFRRIAGYSDARAPGRLDNWDADSNTIGSDAATMNAILNDIDCCEGPNSYAFDVPNGLTKLQAFWQGNAETRLWDIMVEGKVSVDEVSSNGFWDGVRFPRDDNRRYTLFEQTVDVTDGRLNVTFGQLYSNGPDHPRKDGHHILSGMVMSRVPLPGDYDGNGMLTTADIAMLTRSIVDGSTDSQFDLNADSEVDVDDHRFWVKNLKNTWFGDANLDGEFNSSDLIVVFQAGKYETDVDAGWHEGDWDGDQRFGTGDLIAAFQDGGYEAGARAAVSAVPEPSSAALMALGVIGICRLRKRR